MLSDCSQNEVRSSQVIVGNLSSLEIDSNHLSYERLSSMLYVWMGWMDCRRSYSADKCRGRSYLIIS